MVTHDLSEALSMSSKIIVLTKRPATIKKIHNIDLKSNLLIDKRKEDNFIKYYDQIWSELNDKQ